MLSSEAVTQVLLAIATGFHDRALNVVAMSPDLVEEERATLWASLDPNESASNQAWLFGDALRALGADRHLVNECYRVSFYSGERWKALSSNPLFAFFAANRAGSPLDKWVHYFPIYDRHLAGYRTRRVRVLEIGVYRGGGLDLLHHYLGPEAQVIGIDIDDSAVAAVRGRYPVLLGDQADPEFLLQVQAEHGPFDVVIDDGGHGMRQQIVSVETLFPGLNEGGTYIVEDCHTSYWQSYADPDPEALTFIDWIKTRVDDLHAYHFSAEPRLLSPWQTSLAAIHAYDSIVVLDKAQHWPPFSELSGSKEFIAYGRESEAIHVEYLATRDAAIERAAEADRRAEQAAANADQRVSVAADELRVLRGELSDAQQRLGRLEGEMTSLGTELSETQSKLLGSWAIIQEMRRSTSWRVTSPLRRMKSVLSRR